MSAALSLFTDPNLAAALEYARRGWHVFPLHSIRADGTCSCGRPDCDKPGKHPCIPDWTKRALTDLGMITIWFAHTFKGANVGVATGAKSGILVLDEDIEDALDRLVFTYGRLPDTLSVMTGRGGSHRYYQHPGGTIPNRVALIKGVDIKGDGGYAILPPSRHKSGRTYDWDGLEGPEAPIAKAPEWLIDLIRSGAANNTGGGGQNGHASHAIGAVIVEGARNSTLASIAGYLRRLDASLNVILAAIRAVNAAQCQPPLADRELITIARSVAKYAPSIIGGLENMPADFDGISLAIQVVPPRVAEKIQALKTNIPGFAQAWYRRKEMKVPGWHAFALSIAGHCVRCGLPINEVASIIGQHHREFGQDAEPLAAAECIRLLAKASLKVPPAEKSGKRKMGGRRK